MQERKRTEKEKERGRETESEMFSSIAYSSTCTSKRERKYKERFYL